MSVLDNWQQWTQFLGDKVTDAKEDGMSKKMIERAAVQIGEYLANHVDPKNEQERVLADMWMVASKDEKSALASCVIKLVEHRAS